MIFKKMLQALKETRIFEVISGLLVRRPMDDLLLDDYKERLLMDIIDSKIPIVYNQILAMPPKRLFPLESHM